MEPAHVSWHGGPGVSRWSVGLQTPWKQGPVLVFLRVLSLRLSPRTHAVRNGTRAGAVFSREEGASPPHYPWGAPR